MSQLGIAKKQENVYNSISTLSAYICCGKNTCCFPLGDRTCCEAIWGGVFVKPKSQATSYFFSPETVLISRIFSFCFSVSIIALDLTFDYQQGFWFAYLTHITYLGLCFYFMIASILSANYCLARNKSEFDRAPNWFEVLVSWWYTSQFTIHLFVPAIYWAYQDYRNYQDFNKESALLRITSIAMHGGDFVLFFNEMLMNKIIFVWGHSVIYIITLIAYLSWASNTGLIWPTGGPDNDGYPYAFLNPRNPGVFTSFLIMCYVTVFCWILAFGVHKIRAQIGNDIKTSNPEVTPEAIKSSETATVISL